MPSSNHAEAHPASPGRLEVICGPMFAGKTTELIRRLQHSTPPVLVIKPARDTRYSVSELVSHDGARMPAHAVKDAAELESVVTTRLRASQTHMTVGIDEAHFFGVSLGPVSARLIELRARVVIAGIERDHRGRAFEPFPSLLCEADEVVKLVSRCAKCGGEAIHSQRLFASEAAIVVGGAESYEPRCRACFDPEECRNA